MKANTRLFGEIDIAEDKIITLEQGIIGFPEMKNFTLIFDADKGEEAAIKWFQSMDEPEFAMPVMNPYAFKEDYEPGISDEILKLVGEVTAENVLVLTTVTVPQEIEKISINLKAPIIINTDTNQGCQVILDAEYPVKYGIYEFLNHKKEGGE